MKFRKRPTVVEAMQFLDDTKDQVYNWAVGAEPTFRNDEPALLVRTIHGDEAVVRLGDWVIREPGAVTFYYPCKPDIFDASYDPVNE